jgi:CHAD domain-containing protein
MSNPSAIGVVNGHIQELVTHLPAIRHGESEAIHQGRVATRRISEVLPLLSLSHPDEAHRLRRLVRTVRRRLGRVRELDVIRDQLESLDERVPLALSAIAYARAALRAQQDHRRRRLIKALERMKVERLHVISPRDGRLLARLRPYATAKAAHGVLRKRIGEQADAVAAALDQSAGLYLPNRLHAVRIAVKKLRYSVEVAEITGLWRPPRLLRDLRRIQARLGSVHDQQVLLEALDDLAAGASGRDVTALNAVVHGDRVREYERYLTRVDRLRSICAACQRFASRQAPAERSRWPWMTSIGILAAPVAVGLFAEKVVPGDLPDAQIGREVPQIG